MDVGAFQARRPGATSVHNLYDDLEDEFERWGGNLLWQADAGMASFRAFKVYAHAYLKEWSDYHRDDEILERIAAAMDFYSRAQGTCGAWRGPPLPDRDDHWPTWIGAPERESVGGSWEWNNYLWDGFSMLYPHLEEKGFLDVKIDHDLNQDTPKISRRKAYTQMALRSFNSAAEMTLARPIANQIIYNYSSLYSTYRALQLLDPEGAAEQKEKVYELAEIASGLRRHPRWGSYMYSPRGMPMEFGYDANYGNGGMQLVNLAELTGFPALEERAREVYEAYAHFVFLDNDSDGHRTLRNTDWISWRVFRGFPGRIRYFLSEYAARELQIPAAIRYFQLRDEHGCRRVRDSRAERQHGELKRHEFRGSGFEIFVSLTEKADKSHPAYVDVEDLAATDYRLPDEREEESAFVDEHLGLVALRHGDARLFASLNWKSRGGRDWVDGRANNIVRLQYTTPVIDRLVTATSMDTPGGPLELSTMRYGPYFVALNGSEEESFDYQVPGDMRGKMATELLTGERQELEDAVIPPASSKVFVLDAGT